MRFLLSVALLAAPVLAADSLDGIWRTEGYGLVFEIRGAKLKAFEVTEATCLPGFSADRDAASATGRDATFRTSDSDVYFVRAGGSGDHRLLHSEGAASDMRIDRIATIPAACSQPAVDTPQGNFDVFARTWAENYISFDLKHADWAKIVADHRAQVTAETSPKRLFDILEDMIMPFGDAHTSIDAPKLKRDFDGLRPGTDRVIVELDGQPDEDLFRKSGMPKLLAIIDEHYLQELPRKFCNDKLQYGHIDDTTGYLRILTFWGYARERGFATGRAALETALDEIFSDPKLKALVIDVRINFGGADPYGLEIASRLATGEYLAYTKEARSDPTVHDRWTPGDPSVVRPSSRPGFRGPVVLLTGPLTISAAETFTQALMGRTPHITRLGENTQGVFSDVLVRHLPNGWIFGLPNEVYRTPEGKTFDGPGIPPDKIVPVFPTSDITARKDSGIVAAIEILRAR